MRASATTELRDISCYVVVSGDGALETLLTKLSAHGNRIVRVATEKGLAIEH